MGERKRSRLPGDRPLAKRRRSIAGTSMRCGGGGCRREDLRMKDSEGGDLPRMTRASVDKTFTGYTDGEGHVERF